MMIRRLREEATATVKMFMRGQHVSQLNRAYQCARLVGGMAYAQFCHDLADVDASHGIPLG